MHSRIAKSSKNGTVTLAQVEGSKRILLAPFVQKPDSNPEATNLDLPYGNLATQAKIKKIPDIDQSRRPRLGSSCGR